MGPPNEFEVVRSLQVGLPSELTLNSAKFEFSSFKKTIVKKIPDVANDYLYLCSKFECEILYSLVCIKMTNF